MNNSELTLTLKNHLRRVHGLLGATVVMTILAFVWLPVATVGCLVIMAALIGVRHGYAASIIESHYNDQIMNGVCDEK